MFFSRPAGHKIVDRGDPTAYDYAAANFTKDLNWYDLDLSAIVPAGAIAIKIYAIIESSTDSNQSMMFRKKGNSDDYNVLAGFIDTATVKGVIQGLVFCDTDRIIQYRCSLGLTTANFVVTGWVL